jgi:K+-sensing histidine kinase KdpD
LLFRGRLESGSISRASASIDLDDLVLEEARRLRERGRVQVFKPFTRLDEARSRDAGGSGLGLAIVHDVVTLPRAD